MTHPIGGMVRGDKEALEMERRRSTSNGVELTREQLRAQLAIDKEALDDCLIRHPDLYYHVSEGYARAVAARDAAKLNLEQAMASIAETFREQALAREEKLTEAAITRKLAANTRIADMEQELLALRTEADLWQALKEAFQQRSFMLREVVQMLITRLASGSLERGMDRTTADLAEARRTALGEMRRPTPGRG